MDVRLDSVFKEMNGVLSVHVTMTAEGYSDRSIVVQGNTAAEVEAALREKISRAKAAIETEKDTATLRQMAEARLDAIKQELGIGEYEDQRSAT